MPPPSPRYPNYVLGVLFVVYVSNFIDRQILTILVQPIKQEFGASDTQMGFLTGFAFALFYTVAGIPIARWADLGNRRSIIAMGLTVWSGMTALSGLAQSFFQLALARPPRSPSVINVFEHAAGYFSKGLSKGEKAYYRSMLKKYRAGQVPVSAVSSVLRAWIVRFEEDYLLPQTFFEPYPEPLMSLSDSGKGREV